MNISAKKPFALSHPSTAHHSLVYPALQDGVGGTGKERMFFICEGHGSGKKSETATEKVAELFLKYVREVNPIGERTMNRSFFDAALRYVERHFSNHTDEHPHTRGMASTFAMLHFNANGSLTIAWIGDIRVFHIRNGQLLYKTDAHLSNKLVGDHYQMLPRTINAYDPSAFGIKIIDDIFPHDYFLLCTSSVLDALNERNLKYLLSQGDGSDLRNESILMKLDEECKRALGDGFSAVLVQVDKALKSPPIEAIEAMAPIDRVDDISAIHFKNTNRRIRPKSKSTSSSAAGSTSSSSASSSRSLSAPAMPSINWGPVLKSLVPVLLIMGLLGGSFWYYLYVNDDDRLFTEHFELGIQSLHGGDHQTAITELQQALEHKISDTLRYERAKRSLQRARIQLLTKEGDRYYAKANLVMAKDFYKQAVQIDPTNSVLSNRLVEIDTQMVVRINSLLYEGDSLFQLKRYTEAYALVEEAMTIQKSSGKKEKEVKALFAMVQPFVGDDANYDEAALAAEEKADTIDNTVSEALAAAEETVTNFEVPAVVNESVLTTPTKVTEPPKPQSRTVEAKKLSDEGDVAFNNGDFKLALQKYQEANGVKSSDRLKGKIADCKKEIKQQKNKLEYNSVIDQANKAFAAKDYEKAKSLYVKAKGYDAAESFLSDKIKQCETQLATAKQAQQSLKQADAYYADGKYQQAKKSYQAALANATDKTAVRQKIALCDQKIEAAANSTANDAPPTSTASKRDIRKAERKCKDEGYSANAYRFLKQEKLFYDVSPETLFKIGKNFQKIGIKNKARECYEAAKLKGSTEASDALLGL